MQRGFYPPSNNQVRTFLTSKYNYGKLFSGFDSNLSGLITVTLQSQEMESKLGEPAGETIQSLNPDLEAVVKAILLYSLQLRVVRNTGIQFCWKGVELS